MSTIEERLEDRLEMAIACQGATTAGAMDPDLARLIRVLEWIRGRRYIKCGICGTDLTLEKCAHHAFTKNGSLLKDHDHSVDIMEPKMKKTSAKINNYKKKKK